MPKFFGERPCFSFKSSSHVVLGNFREIARLISVQCYYMYNNADKINEMKRC